MSKIVEFLEIKVSFSKVLCILCFPLKYKNFNGITSIYYDIYHFRVIRNKLYNENMGKCVYKQEANEIFIFVCTYAYVHAFTVNVRVSDSEHELLTKIV